VLLHPGLSKPWKTSLADAVSSAKPTVFIPTSVATAAFTRLLRLLQRRTYVNTCPC